MAVKVEQALRMVGGAGETSYANNSKVQEKAISLTKHIVEEAVVGVICNLLPDQSIVVADLGCSSGPNTFLVVSEVINAVGRSCHRLGRRPPETHFFLNDLPGNDFNTIFQFLPIWYDAWVRDEKQEKIDVPPYYVAGVPGSFYGRIFPAHTIHFFHSSFSLMWLSQVPQGLESSMGAHIHKKNIYIAKTTPPCVIKLYSEQYERDFSTFLKARSKEIIPGGRMVLTFFGRKSSNPSGGVCHLWGLLAEALNAMVSEGLLKESLVDDFYLPFYAPSMDEVKAIVRSEGSFDFDRVQVSESNWDPLDDSTEDFVFENLISGEMTARTIRAVTEPMLVSHFGGTIIDNLFSRYKENVARHLLIEKTKHVTFTISLKTRVMSNY